MIKEYYDELVTCIQANDINGSQDLIKIIKTSLHNLNENEKLEWIEKIRIQENLLNDKRKDSLLSYAQVNQCDKKSNDTILILKQSLNELQNTEKIGIDTINHLQEQHDTINRMTNKTQKINKDMGYSSKLLTKMKSIFR